MVNEVTLVGNTGQDPELKYTQNDLAIATFSLATSERYKGETKTEWHRCVAFGKLAEIIGEYVKKGQTLYCRGRLQTRQWEKDGEKRYTTEVVLDKMQMIGGKSYNNDKTEEEVPF